MIFANYKQRILHADYDNLITYLPMDEHAGTTAIDNSKLGLDGTWESATLNNDLGKDGRGVALFDAINDRIDIWSTGLETAFDGDEGTAMIWLKCADWTGTTTRGAFQIFYDTKNYVHILTSDVNEITFRYESNNSYENYDETSSKNDSQWYHVAASWSYSNDRVRFYLDGALLTTLNTFGAWQGTTLDTDYTQVGMRYNDGWDGNLQHFGLWKTELSTEQIKTLAVI